MLHEFLFPSALLSVSGHFQMVLCLCLYYDQYRIYSIKRFMQTDNSLTLAFCSKGNKATIRFFLPHLPSIDFPHHDSCALNLFFCFHNNININKSIFINRILTLLVFCSKDNKAMILFLLPHLHSSHFSHQYFCALKLFFYSYIINITAHHNYLLTEY